MRDSCTQLYLALLPDIGCLPCKIIYFTVQRQGRIELVVTNHITEDHNDTPTQVVSINP